MTPQEEQLFEATEALYAWLFIPDDARMLGDVKTKADEALRLYESSLPALRARLEKAAMV